MTNEARKKGENNMAEFKIGDLVRIRTEWANAPAECSTLYRVVNVNEATGRYYIEEVNSRLALAPQELVAEYMIEKA
jgi:hypothetical protein